ncbi:hypothetical protein IEQ34_023131 [Dendrobium chrysotoxum]|uniref:Uncharacterized protein n=1 Tax=Dendrobium chrysotoxum TaxID=161865 RepID=A0AAV7FZW8_DENCH|nr:hypothetical protein IEQ34_023131 [Dendrobium chrysotoxum]
MFRMSQIIFVDLLHDLECVHGLPESSRTISREFLFYAVVIPLLLALNILDMEDGDTLHLVLRKASLSQPTSSSGAVEAKAVFWTTTSQPALPIAVAVPNEALASDILVAKDSDEGYINQASKVQASNESCVGYKSSSNNKRRPTMKATCSSPLPSL